MNSTRTIYCLCPDSNIPSGGVRKLYWLVDILNSLNLKAYILHAEWGFRCDWFESETPVVYLSSPYGSLSGYDENNEIVLQPPFNDEDLLVIPEIYAFQTVPLLSKWGLKGMIYNQGIYKTFKSVDYPSIPFSAHKGEEPFYYLDERIIGTLVVSEYAKNYLNFLNPRVTSFLIHNSINEKLFFYSKEKIKQIAYMPRRNTEDIQIVISTIRERGKLKEWTFSPIENVCEVEVGRKMRESSLFLSFSDREGFGMPPAEAMACGCSVIGYHGQGGREYFKRPYAYPIESGDILHFVQTIEDIALNQDSLVEERKLASEFILQNYSQKREKEDLKNALHQLGIHPHLQL